MIVEIIIYLIIGALGGVVVSLVGAGSSLIVLPVLLVLMPHIFGVIGIKMAVGTTMGSITVAAISAAIRQRKYVKINKQVALPVLCSYILAALAGAVVAHFMPAPWLHYYVSALIFLVACKNLFFIQKDKPLKPLPNNAQLFFVAFVIGFLCCMAGIASGLLFIPFITRYLEHRVAVATSIFCGTFFAIFGTIGYIITGLHQSGLPHWSLGYIYLPAFVLISLATIASVPFFMRIAHSINVQGLKKIFYVFLFCASVYLFFA